MAARPRPLPSRASPAAAAVERFLDALGLPEDVRGSAELAATPERVADAWLEDLVDGYRADPARILADGAASPSRDLVAVTGIEFHSVCPHHLLPSLGVAHVAYLPGGRLTGFGQIVRLVNAFAHRLVLQEDLALQIVEALVEHLGARGAGCVLEAQHLCLTARGERRSGARVYAEAFSGELAREGRGRKRFLEAIARAGRAAEAAPGARSRGRR